MPTDTSSNLRSSSLLETGLDCLRQLSLRSFDADGECLRPPAGDEGLRQSSPESQGLWESVELHDERFRQLVEVKTFTSGEPVGGEEDGEVDGEVAGEDGGDWPRATLEGTGHFAIRAALKSIVWDGVVNVRVLSDV